MFPTINTDLLFYRTQRRNVVLKADHDQAPTAVDSAATPGAPGFVVVVDDFERELLSLDR